MYNKDLSWNDWTVSLGSVIGATTRDLAMANQWCDKWAALTYGLTDAQIQALPQFSAHSVGDITAMRYAWGVFTDLHNALYNVAALAQADRAGYLAPFVS